MIKSLNNKDIKDEDWTQIKQALENRDLCKEDIRICDFEKLGLFKYETQISAISQKASYKELLSKELEEIVVDMDQVQLIVNQETQTIENYHQIRAKLEKHCASTKSILESEYMEGRIQKKANKFLQQVGDMTELISSTQ